MNNIMKPLAAAVLMFSSSPPVLSASVNYLYSGNITSISSNITAFYDNTQQLSGNFLVNDADINNAPSVGRYVIEFVDVNVGDYSGSSAPFNQNQDYIIVENDVNGIDSLNINASTIMIDSIFADGGEYVPQILWFDISDTSGNSLTNDSLATGDILSSFSNSIATNGWGLEYMCVSGACMYDMAFVGGSITSLSSPTVPIPGALWLFVSGGLLLYGSSCKYRKNA